MLSFLFYFYISIINVQSSTATYTINIQWLQSLLNTLFRASVVWGRVVNGPASSGPNPAWTEPEPENISPNLAGTRKLIWSPNYARKNPNVKLVMKSLAMLSDYFDYILRQKVRLRPESSPKFLSTLSPNPAQTRPEKPGPTYNSGLRHSILASFQKLLETRECKIWRLRRCLLLQIQHVTFCVSIHSLFTIFVVVKNKKMNKLSEKIM